MAHVDAEGEGEGELEAERGGGGEGEGAEPLAPVGAGGGARWAHETLALGGIWFVLVRFLGIATWLSA